VRRDDREIVFVARGDRVEEAQIRTGGRINGMIEVLEGLKSGERIAANPPARLKGGAKIRVVEK
jgi:multidrug efflux pump subunit AcrA (membrane-fusion protein)